MDMRTITLLARLAQADEPTRARAGLGPLPAGAWCAAASAALTLLLGAALLGAPVVLWAVWLRSR